MLLKHIDLVKNANVLMEMRSRNHPTIYTRKYLKERGYEWEGRLFRLIPDLDEAFIDPEKVQEKGIEAIYGRHPRKIMYYPDIDFYKYQANWGQTFGQPKL